ncbi:hypothetical protein Mpe_B0613 (plasmid) [Methylibium petroleiphilum PM1]|uniref:Transmembrane protein n=1 Tax=Methylibium petroleiphilum (strain ATCC BAA-1232 / LMG 22953 / PM1) TaxID=420662 RepID=A2SP88_METPP|nr:hypothetical protein Mpe_B0613 [Methylibium petroleiphilum PM1]
MRNPESQILPTQHTRQCVPTAAELDDYLGVVGHRSLELFLAMMLLIAVILARKAHKSLKAEAAAKAQRANKGDKRRRRRSRLGR